MNWSSKYSPDSKSFAFGAIKNWKYIIVKDWIEINEYDNAENLIYSPDGKSFAFMATKNEKNIQILMCNHLNFNKQYLSGNYSKSDYYNRYQVFEDDKLNILNHSFLTSIFYIKSIFNLL